MTSNFSLLIWQKKLTPSSPSKIATVIIDEANWFDGKTLFRHPDTFKRLPARRMSFQNALAQYLENPPVIFSYCSIPFASNIFQ
jgi:hypothetical protein